MLPQGTVWAWLDAGDLDAILNRSRPPAELVGQYRGSTAVSSGAAQVAEAAVLADVGWSWLDSRRTAEVVERREELSIVEVTSTVGSWEAEVIQVGVVPQPVCGVAQPEVAKHDPVLELRALRCTS